MRRHSERTDRATAEYVEASHQKQGEQRAAGDHARPGGNRDKPANLDMAQEFHKQMFPELGKASGAEPFAARQQSRNAG